MDFVCNWINILPGPVKLESPGLLMCAVWCALMSYMSMFYHCTALWGLQPPCGLCSTRLEAADFSYCGVRVCQMSASFHTMNSSELFFFFFYRSPLLMKGHVGWGSPWLRSREREKWKLCLSSSNSAFMYIYMHIYTFSTFPGRFQNWKIFDLLLKNNEF